MTKVLAVRTADGHYFELATLRVKTEDGELNVKLDEAAFVQILDVEPQPHIYGGGNGDGPHSIGGVGGIRSEENVNGLG
jgi:hypothetical protein